MAKQYELTEDFVGGVERRANQVDWILRWIKGFTVTGAERFVNNDSGASIAISKGKDAPPPAAVPPVYIVKLTGSASGGGKYNARTFGRRTGTPTATGNLAESDIGTLASTDDAIFEAINEIGASTHVWTTPGVTVYGIGIFGGRTADGKVVVQGIPFPVAPCEVSE